MGPTGILWWARSPATRWAVNALPGAGAPSLAGEDRGDLLVGILLGELAHERDGVLVGAARVAAGARKRHAVLGDRAALPHDPQLGGVLLGSAVDGHENVGEDRAQQLLALAVACGGRVEHLAQVRAGTATPRDLFLAERVRALRRDLGRGELGSPDRGQALFPFAFQGAGDEPVLGL